MNTDSSPLVIDYYSDVLCIWSWVAQKRNDELKKQWGEQVVLRHHCLNLFGSTERRIQQQWQHKGGFQGFAQYVEDSAKPFEEAQVHPELWRKVKPSSSLNAHLLIKACQQLYGDAQSEQLALAIRQAFYTHAQNIGLQALLMDIATQQGLSESTLTKALATGEAAAALMADYQMASENNIKGSPSWVLDGGRQVLYGNVGYRVLNANVEELLRNPSEEASWC